MTYIITQCNSLGPAASPYQHTETTGVKGKWMTQTGEKTRNGTEER